jgi:hypothetical protein
MDSYNIVEVLGFWQTRAANYKSVQNNIIPVYFHTMEYNHLCMDMDYGA